MNNEEIYALVCKLFWRTDLLKPQIAEMLKKEGIRCYTHVFSNNNRYTHYNLIVAVDIIIKSEISSQTKANESRIKKLG